MAKSLRQKLNDRNDYQTFVEASLKDGRYKVIFRGTYEECTDLLDRWKYPRRLDVWCKYWVTTSMGHSPLAWKGKLMTLD